MAVALVHGVINYCNTMGYPVYACSLDAEAAFDGIPHCVMVSKLIKVVHDMFWRILVYWYSRLIVQIRWQGALSKPIKISRGTRQGGLSYPFIFNIFYKDMVDIVSHMLYGIKVGSHT